jgi:hypothetical protein
MKKFYLPLFCAFISLAGRAQINKGDILLGGNIGYQTQTTTYENTPNTTPYKSDDLTIDPSFARAFKNNSVAGFDLSIGHDYSNPGSGSETSNYNLYGAGIFLRRYRPLGNGFYLFGQARLGGSYDHDTYSNLGTPPGTPTASSYSTGQVAISLFPGIAYALDRHWQVETELPGFLSISYYHQRQTSTYETGPQQITTTNSFDLSSALTGSNSLSVGVRYIIGN